MDRADSILKWIHLLSFWVNDSGPLTSLTLLLGGLWNVSRGFQLVTELPFLLPLQQKAPEITCLLVSSSTRICWYLATHAVLLEHVGLSLSGDERWWSWRGKMEIWLFCSQSRQVFPINSLLNLLSHKLDFSVLFFGLCPFGAALPILSFYGTVSRYLLKNKLLIKDCFKFVKKLEK